MSVAHRYLPTLQELRSLDAVSRLCSVSAAARELGLTQPTVSYHIKKLEQKWGARLFRLKGKTLEPTEILRSILFEVRTATHQVEQIGQLLGTYQQQKVLSVSLTPSLASIVLHGRLNRFLDLFPDINLRVCATNRFQDLQKDQIDVALRLLPRTEAADSSAWQDIMVPLPDEKMQVVCAPAYWTALTAGLPPAKQDPAALLAEAELIHEDETVHWSKLFTSCGCKSANTRPRRLTFSNADLILQAAVSGRGLALLRESYTAEALAAGGLIALPGLEMPCDRVFQFVVSDSSGMTSTALQFVSWFGQELRALPAAARQTGNSAPQSGTEAAQ